MPISILVNNMQSKCALDSVKIKIVREMEFTGRDFSSKPVVQTLSTLAIADKIEVQTVAKAARPTPVESQLPLTYNQQTRICKDDSRTLYLYDIKDGRPLQVELKQAQYEFLPSTNTELIKCNYFLLIEVYHKHTLSSSQDLPTIKIPFAVAKNPEGQLDPIINLAATMRQSASQASMMPAQQMPQQ